ncbi:MAG: ankyrin repeat domain-containing protein [Verrucomicrobia bacterium]|nr:ankyrin repeat domain-containing protein [Verrucomicrobiota bacterium]
MKNWLKILVLLLMACGPMQAGEIHDAVKSGDLEKLKQLLAAKPELVNERDKYESTPLHCAVFQRKKAIVELLLAYKANVNAKDGGGFTPIAFVRLFNPELAALLRSHGATYSDQPIFDAIEDNDVAKVKQLLEEKPELVNERDKGGRTPLHYAVFRGGKAIVELLFAYKANVNAKDNDGLMPMASMRRDNPELTALLRSHGGTYSDQPIFDAIEDRDVAKVRELLARDPTLVNAREKIGITPLIAAVFSGHMELVRLLLSYKADINAKGDRGGTPLAMAIMQKNLPMAEFLIACNANVNNREKSGHTPLHWAAGGGSLPLIQLLLANKADVNARCDRGSTPLMCAAQFDKKEAVEKLLANKADVNAKTNRGKTALHFAADCGSKSVVETLLANHADMNSRDERGRTPLDLAKESDREEADKIVDILRTHGGKSGKELGDAGAAKTK